MITEINRTQLPDGSSIVQRVVNGEVQTLKETVSDSGEIVSVSDDMITIQTITITRRIGEKITF